MPLEVLSGALTVHIKTEHLMIDLILFAERKDQQQPLYRKQNKHKSKKKANIISSSQSSSSKRSKLLKRPLPSGSVDGVGLRISGYKTRVEAGGYRPSLQRTLPSLAA